MGHLVVILGIERNFLLFLLIDSEQQSEDYDSESRLHSRQGCNSRRSGTFISDDEEDGDKGKGSFKNYVDRKGLVGD